MIVRTVPRGDQSDVSFLDCVFVEMVTLVPGETFGNMIDHYVDSKLEVKPAEDYYLHLEELYSWIDHLRSLRTEPGRLGGYEEAQRVSGLSLFGTHEDQQMMDASLCTHNMLSKNPDDRPKSEELFRSFACVVLQQCRDCDPRHADSFSSGPRLSTMTHTRGQCIEPSDPVDKRTTNMQTNIDTHGSSSPTS